MAGRPRWWAAGLSLALVAALVLVLLTRGEDDPAPVTPRATEVRPDLAADVLRNLEDAVAARDPDAAEELADPGDEESQELVRGIATNADGLRIRDFAVRYVDEDRALTAGLQHGHWAAVVETSWRFGGAGRRVARTEVTFTFATEGSRGFLVSVGGGERRTPLWLSEPLAVRRGAGTLVIVAGGADAVDSFVRHARQAVRVVRRVLPRWRQTLVVEVPQTAEDLDAVLGAEPGEYSAIAAVTATTDGSSASGSLAHVFVNPEVFGGLERQGARVVMSHEATHVATEATSAQTPLWLLEGFADYVALRDVSLPLNVTAGQIIRQVRRDGPPDALPGRTEFDTQTTHLGAAYEAAWIACRVLAEVGGETALVELNRRVSDGSPVDEALRAEFGFGETELTRRWRRELTRVAE